MSQAVLVVDDSLVTLDTVSANLRRLGYDPKVASDVATAAKTLTVRRADYIIFGLGLASGPELPELDQLRAACDTTIIVMPADNALATVGNAMAAGAHGMLVPRRAALLDYETALVFAHERWMADRPDFQPAPDETLVETLLADLMRRAPLAAWTVTPRSDQPTRITPRGGRTGLPADVAVAWSSYLSARLASQSEPMVLRHGVPAGSNLPALGGAVTVPVRGADGQVYGTLCGLHTAEILNADALITEATYAARFLAGALDLEEQVVAAETRAARAEASGGVDLATGLLGEAGFDAAVEHEDRRARRNGRNSAVVIVSVPELAQPPRAHDHATTGARDALAKNVCRAIADSVRGSDPVFRIGPGLFAIIAAECEATSTPIAARRVSSRLDAAQVAHHAAHGNSVNGTLRTAAREAQRAVTAPAKPLSKSLSERLVRSA